MSEPSRIDENKVKVSRRDFITHLTSTGLAIGGVCAGAWWLHNREDPWAPPPAVKLKKFNVQIDALDPKLAIVHGKDPLALVRAAVGELGGIEKFIKPGDRVVVKPNVAFDRPPKLGATTSPEILKAVIQVVRDAGASKITVTDNPINSPESCFHKSGIKLAAQEMGASIFMPKPSGFQPLEVNGGILSTWPMLYEPFQYADKVIGVAPLKDHNLCHASMTMKNWYGLLGGRRNQFHQAIYDIVTDLAFMMTPTLVFLDATRILVKNGPTGGGLSDVKEGNTLICGTDQVAVDTYGLTQLLQRPAAKVKYLQMAHERGLGNMNWKELPHREIQI